MSARFRTLFVPGRRKARNPVKGVKGLDSRYPDVCKVNIKLGNFPVDRVRIDKIEI